MKLLKQRALKKWREKALKTIEDRVQSEVATHERYIREAQEAGRVAEILVKNTDIQFESMPYIEAIGGQVRIWHGSRELVHHLAKKLHLTFKKEFKTYMGSMTYVAELGNATIEISDIKNIPHCEIIKVTEVKEVTTYELKCH